MSSIKSLLWVGLIANTALAQHPGQNISARIDIASVTPHADTAGVSYVVSVLPGSVEPLARFSVDVPGGVLRIGTPGNLWIPLSQFRGRPLAHWIAADSLPAGSVTPELHFEAVGVPGILTYWVGGVFTFPSLEEPEATDIVDNDPLTSEMISGQTVGIEAWPADRTPQALIARLGILTQRTCTSPLSWITSSTLCAELTGYVDQAEASRSAGHVDDARSALTQFTNAISGSSSGTFAPGVTSPAYWLLRANADIIAATL